jgi:cyclopropane-fatty-acyl-phospholipid synthase
MLSKIISGQITVHVSATSEIFVFGHTDPPLQATIYVRDNAFWTRVAFFTDLGFAEAFMFGDGMVLLCGFSGPTENPVL